MSQFLEKYEQMHEIVLDDGRVFYIGSSHIDAFAKKGNENRFVQIGEVWIAAKKINEMRPSSGRTGIENYPSEIRAKVLSRADQYKRMLGKQATREQMIGWAERAKNGENIMNTSHQTPKDD